MPVMAASASLRPSNLPTLPLSAPSTSTALHYDRSAAQRWRGGSQTPIPDPRFYWAFCGHSAAVRVVHMV
jgi:hypothetical protein